MFKKDLLLHTLKKTSPVLIGYFFLGLGFGILLEKAGYKYIECLLLSVFVFSGSLQYAGVSLLTSGASLITVFITSLIINARYFFYSLSLVDKYNGTGNKKLYLIHGIVDEAYALISDNEYLDKYKEEDYWFLVTLLDHLYWIISTLIGVFIGSLIQIEIKGIDFVMTALFVSIFTEQLIKNKDRLPSLLGLIIPLIFLIIIGRDNFLLPSLIIISLISGLYGGKE